MNGCPVVEPNHQWQGQSYIATWLINGDGRQVWTFGLTLISGTGLKVKRLNNLKAYLHVVVRVL